MTFTVCVVSLGRMQKSAVLAGRALRTLASMVAPLPSAFSGGIGEGDAALRADVAARLGWMGVRVDEAANRQASAGRMTPIHAPGSTVEVWVVPTDEGRVAAGDAAALLAGAPTARR